MSTDTHETTNLSASSNAKSPSTTMTMEVIRGDMEMTAKRIAGVSSEGINLILDGDNEESLVLGESLQVRVVIGPNEGVLDVEVEALRQTAGGDVQCRFAVADPESLRSSLPEALMEVFEQRSSRRVSIGETYAEVMVVCEDGRAATTGRILGISERGISACLDPRALHIIPEGANVSLSFRLPGSHNELHPWGLVRSVKPVDEGLVYGLEFLPLDTPDFDEIRREIRTFVVVETVTC